MKTARSFGGGDSTATSQIVAFHLALRYLFTLYIHIYICILYIHMFVCMLVNFKA